MAFDDFYFPEFDAPEYGEMLPADYGFEDYGGLDLGYSPEEYFPEYTPETYGGYETPVDPEQYLYQETFYDTATGQYVNGQTVAQEDPGYWQQLTTGVQKFIKENPKEAIALGIGVGAGLPMMLRGLLGNEPEISGGSTEAFNRILGQMEARAGESVASRNEALARFYQVQQGNFGPSAF